MSNINSSQGTSNTVGFSKPKYFRKKSQIKAIKAAPQVEEMVQVTVPKPRSRRRKTVINKNIIKVQQPAQKVQNTVHDDINRVLNKGLDKESLEWIHYALDPFGAKEKMALTVGKIPSIPDGLMSKGLSGENRQVNFLNYPGVDTITGIPLSGSQWNLYILCIPGFRINFVVIASTGPTINSDIMAAAYTAINTAIFLPGQVDTPWMPLPNETQWFWRAVFYNRNASLPEPTYGVSQTVSKWRTITRAWDFVFNAPTLLNMGIDTCGQFQQSNTMRVVDDAASVDGVPIRVAYSLTLTSGTGSTLITKLTTTAPISVGWLNYGNILGNSMNPATRTHQQIYNGAAPIATIEYTTVVDGDSVTAVIGNRIYWTCLFLTNTNYTFNLVKDTGAGTTIVVMYTSAPQTFVSSVPVTGGFDMNILDANDDELPIANRNLVVTTPSLVPSDISSNDPNFQMGLDRVTDGVYAVAYKFSNLNEWQFTESADFTPIRLTTAGVDQDTIASSTGIRDSLDVNLSFPVITFNGISSSTQIAVNSVMAWEGMVAPNSAMGQFQHQGASACPAARQFYDDFVGSARGIYPAKANFLGSLFKTIVSALGGLKLRDATANAVGGLARWGVGKLFDFIGLN